LGRTAWVGRSARRLWKPLKATQFKPGTSGNAGGVGKKRKEQVLDAAMKMLANGKVKPSDTVADFMNYLLDDDSLRQCGLSGRRREEFEKRGSRRRDHHEDRRLEDELRLQAVLDRQHGRHVLRLGEAGAAAGS